MEDVEGIVHLAEKLIDLYYNTPERSKGKTIQISISCATFVPKPFTPFEFETAGFPRGTAGTAGAPFKLYPAAASEEDQSQLAHLRDQPAGGSACPR